METKNVTRNCNETVAIATVNGMFPGPTLDINEGDTMVIKVTSNIDDDVTLHWWDLIPLPDLMLINHVLVQLVYTQFFLNVLFVCLFVQSG